MTGIPPWLDTTGGVISGGEFYDGPTDMPVFTVPEGMGGKYLVSWHGTLLGGSGKTEMVSVTIDGHSQATTTFLPHDEEKSVDTQCVLDLKGGQVIAVSVTASSTGRRSVVTRLG